MRSGVDPTKLKAWNIGFLESKDQHGDEFKTLMTYCDQLMMRGWRVPICTAR